MVGWESTDDASPWRPGFLRRVATRPYRPNRDEREDRFTEILAAVLDHPKCASLGPYLAQGWLDLAAQGRAKVPRERGVELLQHLASAADGFHVATQRAIRGRARRLDLVLVFELAANAELTISLEAKLDAEPADDQLRDYVEWVSSLSGPGLVILAAPRSRYASFDPHQVPPEVAQIPWETTAALLKQYLEHVTSGEAETLLVRELLAYMREEDLVDPDKLEPRHIQSLVTAAEAWRGFSAVVETADAYLEEHWGAKLGSGGLTGETPWRNYPSRLSSEPGALGEDISEFGWNIWLNGQRWFPDTRPDVPIFGAGIFRRDWMSAETDRMLSDHRFELFSKMSGTYRGGVVSQTRVYRRIQIDDPELGLIGGETLEDQGNAVGAWIQQAFQDLHDALSAPAVQQEYSS